MPCGSGGRWDDCPREVYGPKKPLYNRFVRWAEPLHLGTDIQRAGGGFDAPGLLIDSTCIKVHRCAGGGKGGALAHGIPQQGGPQHQARHAADAKGRPLVLLLTPAKPCAMIEGSPSAVSKPCPPRALNSSPTRAMTAPPSVRLAGRTRNHGRHPSPRKSAARSNTIMGKDRLQAARHHRAHVLPYPSARTGAV